MRRPIQAPTGQARREGPLGTQVLRRSGLHCLGLGVGRDRLAGSFLGPRSHPAGKPTICLSDRLRAFPGALAARSLRAHSAAVSRIRGGVICFRRL